MADFEVRLGGAAITILKREIQRLAETTFQNFGVSLVSKSRGGWLEGF